MVRVLGTPLLEKRFKVSWFLGFKVSKIYLKASPLPPAPLAVAGFMVAGLVPWQYYDRLAGLLGFAVWFLFR